MILDATIGPLAMSSLRCWDESDELIQDVVWFNPAEMIASARVDRTEQRVRVGRYCFRCFNDDTADLLRDVLPPHLHCWIQLDESPRTE